MKATHRLFIIFTALMLAASMVSAGAEGLLLPGKGPLDAYEDLLAAFDLGDYDKARTILEEHQLDILNVRDARQYALYLDALDYMDNASYALAASLFESLAREKDGFRDSQTLYAYCAGRAAEAAGDYEAAVAHYKLSAAYGDSVSRMSACQVLQGNAQAEQARLLHQQGLALQDTALLEEALALYGTLGDAAKVAQCRQDIQNMQKQISYNAAVAQYNEAVAARNPQALQMAASVFSALGDFGDSRAMVTSIQGLLQDWQRSLTVQSASATASSITLSWQDTSTDGRYIIVWGPENMSAAGTLTTQETSCTLEDLLPGTAYTVAVADESNTSHRTAISISTGKADAYAAPGFFVSRASLISIRRSYLGIASLESLLANSPQVLVYPEDNRMVLNDAAVAAQDMTYCYTFSYRQSRKTDEPVTMQWLLRTKSAGVYASAVSSYDSLPENGRLFCELDPLLDQLYLQHGAWPAEACTVELYLGGQLAATGLLIIGD